MNPVKYVCRSGRTFVRRKLPLIILIGGLAADMIASGIILRRLSLRHGIKDEISLFEERVQSVRHAVSESQVLAIGYINEERGLSDEAETLALLFVTYVFAPHPVIPCAKEDECVDAIVAFGPKRDSGRIAILRRNATAVSVSFQDFP